MMPSTQSLNAMLSLEPARWSEPLQLVGIQLRDTSTCETLSHSYFLKLIYSDLNSGASSSAYLGHLLLMSAQQWSVQAPSLWGPWPDQGSQTCFQRRGRYDEGTSKKDREQECGTLSLPSASRRRHTWRRRLYRQQSCPPPPPSSSPFPTDTLHCTLTKLY